jgi:hypothetical protein
MVVRFGYRDHVPTMRPMYDCKFVANIVTLSIYLLNGGVPVLAADGQYEESLQDKLLEKYHKTL